MSRYLRERSGWRWLLAAILLSALPGCLVYSVAKTTVKVATTAVETTVDVTAAGVGALIPEGDDDAEKEDK